jgi:hypothetical protein
MCDCSKGIIFMVWRRSEPALLIHPGGVANATSIILKHVYKYAKNNYPKGRKLSMQFERAAATHKISFQRNRRHCSGSKESHLAAEEV